MKFWLIFLIFSLSILENSGEDLKCEGGGCYEVIKTFAELLEQKIIETDAVSEIFN